MNISINSTTVLESKIFEEAVSAVVDSGTIVVASSGNNYASAKNHPPANVKKAIVVAGSIEGNTPYSPSNRGTVDLAAPGQDVLCADAENGKATGLILKSGTSFSAPFVSAAAAILKSIDSSLSPSEVENILKRTVTPWSGTYTSYGTGIVNFVNMLNPYRIDSPTVNVDWDTNTVTLTTPESVPNAEIYYTLDGTEPTKDTGIRYTEPIVVERRVEKIKIIACISGELPSKVVNYVLKFSPRKWNIRYKATEQLELPNVGMKVLSWSSSDSTIVSVDSTGKITAHKAGEAVVRAKIAQSRYIEYEVKVEYAWWQWLIIILLFGWLWYI